MNRVVLSIRGPRATYTLWRRRGNVYEYHHGFSCVRDAKLRAALLAEQEAK
jgi:hypothetical protein